MKYIYCPQCGTQLIGKEIGDEGEVPFCQACSRPWFDQSYTCTITLVVNEYDQVALIRQGYISNEYFVCVAGYMKPGESGEETACREVKEELGLDVEEIRYTGSHFLPKRDMLMLAFEAQVKKGEFHLSGEVDQAEWFTFNEAHEKMRKGTLAIQLLEQYFAKKGQPGSIRE